MRATPPEDPAVARVRSHQRERRLGGRTARAGEEARGLIRAGAAAAALFLAQRADAADPDPWLGRDKALHAVVSAGIAAGGYGAAASQTDDRGWRLLTGAGLALGAGVGKEVLDLYGLGDASWRDLTWDVIGTATGLGVAWIIDRLISGR
jgi:uncharacterized protein YfiM (DUF2279 family)